MNTEKVSQLVKEAIEENSSLFLIELNFVGDNEIHVVVDGDSGVPLSECIRISRHIEHNLDRESEDFSLEVTSPSITDNIVNKRQYNKNLNRILKIKTDSDNFEGTLIDIGEQAIKLQWKAREPKPIGKGKITVVKEKMIPFDSIKQAKVKIIF